MRKTVVLALILGALVIPNDAFTHEKSSVKTSVRLAFPYGEIRFGYPAHYGRKYHRSHRYHHHYRQVWMPGHWEYKGRHYGYVWVPGRWVYKPVGSVWVRGHWKLKNLHQRYYHCKHHRPGKCKHYTWVPGHWEHHRTTRRSRFK